MNNPEISGIVSLEDLPKEEIFIGLKTEFFSELKTKIRELGIYTFVREINVNEGHIRHWLSDGSLIRLDILFKILNYFNYNNWEDKIDFFRGKKGNVIKNPKLPFSFRNKSGVRLIASILGDGGLSNKDIIYSNTNEVLIKDFISDLDNVFGRVGFYVCKYKRKNKVIQVVYPPAFLRYMFDLLGVKIGEKVVNNPKIPAFIYQLPSECIYEFVSKMVDDEGSINVKGRHIGIVSVTEDNHHNSNILSGIKDLLLKEGIHSEIYAEKPYTSIRGGNRIKRKLQINNYEQLEKLYYTLNIRSENKLKNFNTLVNSYLQIQYSKKRCKYIYLSKMKFLENLYGSFNVNRLSLEVNRNIGHVRNMIHKYHSLNLIKCIKPYKAGKSPTVAEYILIKNGNNI